ncbi:MAG: hypothetical protein JNK02_02880 [Planctomycetes bacterium]|nr:hypothetical protein [Planctomycetota bacterium]
MLPRAQAAMPSAELLGPGEALRAHWPDARPNTWPTRRAVGAPAEPRSAATSPSWLLALDDADLPPAHPAFVPGAAPANASYSEGEPVAERVAPWFLRGLWIVAGLVFVAVVTRTLLLRTERAPREAPAPLQPELRAPGLARPELADPSARSARLRPAARPTPAPTPAPAAPLAVYGVPAEEPSASALAQEARARDDVDGWLAAHSRNSAPLADTVPAPPGSAPAASGGGIWEGATIPVEAISGGLRLETPAVGLVRVRLADGERIEGRLVALGQGRVWIRTEGGTLEVERDRLRALEQIAERAAPGGPEAPRRQRVRTAGGVFYGRVLARDGRTVTLVTDAGTRVSVEADEVSDAEPE